MNPRKQFWTLVKFQATVSPFVILAPVAFVMPMFFMWQQDLALSFLVQNQNFFLIWLFGALLLAPEIFSSVAGAQNIGMGAEFIRTRAVDKVIVARAKTAFFLFVALVGPAAVLLTSFGKPSLRVSVYGTEIQNDCLSHVAGSVLEPNRHGNPNLISIPSGHVLVGAWHLWEFLVMAAVIQLVVYAIYPCKSRRYIFWALFIGFSFAPLLGFYRNHSSTPFDEHLFFCYASNQVAFWSIGVAAAIAAQLWCERRFARLEQ
jgi:hypothetical protein